MSTLEDIISNESYFYDAAKEEPAPFNCDAPEELLRLCRIAIHKIARNIFDSKGSTLESNGSSTTIQ